MIRFGTTSVLFAALAGCAASGPPTAAISTPPAAVAVIESTAQTAAPTDMRQRFIDSATAMLGQPYRYGGAAPGGFDCSGLVTYAAQTAGFTVPRTALAQLHSGSAVPRGEIKAGDLVFMHLARKQLHVGIALDDTRFIDAPASGGYVRIDSLASRSYATGYIGARRIIAE